LSKVIFEKRSSTSFYKSVIIIEYMKIPTTIKTFCHNTDNILNCTNNIMSNQTNNYITSYLIHRPISIHPVSDALTSLFCSEYCPFLNVEIGFNNSTNKLGVWLFSLSRKWLLTIRSTRSSAPDQLLEIYNNNYKLLTTRIMCNWYFLFSNMRFM
jgi:hypothetical protein